MRIRRLAVVVLVAIVLVAIALVVLRAHESAPPENCASVR